MPKGHYNRHVGVKKKRKSGWKKFDFCIKANNWAIDTTPHPFYNRTVKKNV